MSIADKIIRAKTDYDEVYEAGKEAQNRAFWEKFTTNANGTMSDNYSYAFAGERHSQEVIDSIPLELKLGNCTGMFYYNTSVIDLSKLPRTSQKTYNWRQTFRDATKLQTVWELDFSSNVVELTATFYNCTALANVTVVAETINRTIDFQWCPLTKESITSIVSGLRSDVTGQTCTFKKSAKEAAFTADEWAELIATKTNWTISLV